MLRVSEVIHMTDPRAHLEFDYPEYSLFYSLEKTLTTIVQVVLYRNPISGKDRVQPVLVIAPSLELRVLRVPG